MFDALAPFTVGLLGSLHCIGMCGPLVVAYSLQFKTSAPRRQGVFELLRGAFSHHLAFHAGRIISYGTLGAMAAALFHSIEVQRFSMQYRGGFMVFAGVVLLVLGFVLLGVFPIPSLVARLSRPGLLGRRIATLANSRTLPSKLAMGLAAGFLPCGLTWAMLVTAASTFDPGKGFLTMASFGFGTLPLLLLTGIGASYVSAGTRLWGEKAAGIAVIAMGLIVLAKGGAILCGMIDHCSL